MTDVLDPETRLRWEQLPSMARAPRSDQAAPPATARRRPAARIAFRRGANIALFAAASAYCWPDRG